MNISTLCKRLALGAVALCASIGAGSASAQTTITLMGYRGGGFQENYVKAVVEPFMKENPDVQVKFHGVQNAAASLGLMRAQKSAPSVDAVIFDLSVAKIAKDEGLIRPLDAARVPNVQKLADSGRELGLFAPPVTYDTLVLLYHAPAFPQPPQSWKVMWDKKYERKVIVPAQGGGDIQAIALTLLANKMAGGTDYRTSIKPGVEMLKNLAPNILTWEPKPDAYALVGSGEALLAIGWNARAQVYFDSTQGKLNSVLPAEGTIAQVNVISMINGTKQENAVQRLINYALSEKAQQAFSELMFYAPTNKSAVINEKSRNRIPLVKKENADKLMPVDWIAVGEQREAILEPWRRQIIPASR